MLTAKTETMRKERAAVDWSPAYKVDVREDLHQTNRHDEDGEPIITSTFHLIATDATGWRWASPHIHDEIASAKSERRHLARSFDPTRAGWYEIEPMYGSAAWTPEVKARLAWREREREAEGWNTGYRW